MMIGQGPLKDIEELSPIGRLIVGLFPKSAYRWQMAAYFGISERQFNNILVGFTNPSQEWLIEKNWPELMQETDGWRANPLGTAKTFAGVLEQLPSQANFKQKQISGTIGEILKLVFPDLKRMEQAAALGLNVTPPAMAAFANRNIFSQEQMALMDIRSHLKRHCAGRVDKQTGQDLWEKVGPMFDVIAEEKITTRIASANIDIIKKWRVCVGDVFRRIREEVAGCDDVAVFFESMDHHAVPIFGNNRNGVRAGLYEAMEQGKGFDVSGNLDGEKRLRRQSYHATRILYLKAAERMCAVYLTDVENNPLHAELKDKLDNLFPEMAQIRRTQSVPQSVLAS